MNKQLLTPGREPIADKSKDTIEVQISKPMSFIEFIFKNIGEGLHIEAEMTQRAASSKPTPA